MRIRLTTAIRVIPALLAFLFFFNGKVLQAQRNGNNGLSVFLDVPSYIDVDFIRQEIPVVEYVRDRAQAHVHIMMSLHRSGATGFTYSISFIGRGVHQDKSFELSYWAPSSNTSYETRKGYTEKIKMGLVPFMAATPLADRVAINFNKTHIEIQDADMIDHDPWNSWVIEVYGAGTFSSEETRSSLHFRYGVFADRITKESKVRMRPYGNYVQRNYKTNNGTITSVSVRGGWDSYYIKSIADHWGLGFFGNIFISTFHNLDFSTEVSPAIEYSLYPYEEATRRSITLSYKVGAGYYDYVEETVFDKTEEFLYGQALVLSADFRQQWGNIRAGLTGFHHFHDFRSNRAELSGIFNLRILEGLSLNLAGSFNLINDLAAIPKSSLSLEEILLEQRRRASSYQFSGNLGLSYTFGSRITGVFNPRLRN